MKTISLICFAIAMHSINCIAQSIPKEKYFVCNRAIASSMTNSYYSEYKRSTLYFNDKFVVVSLVGFPKSPMIFHVWSKKYNSDHSLVLQCFSEEMFAHKDSVELSRSNRTLTITIDTTTTNNYKPSVTISFLFSKSAMTINFFNVKSDEKDITIVRKKYYPILNRQQSIDYH